MAIGTLPQLLNEDTLPVLLRKQLGLRLLGDAELHILAGMPVDLNHLISAASVTAAATTAGFSTADNTKITAELAKRKASK